MLNTLLLVLCAALAGAAGGAVAGVRIGGEAMGNQIAALMGSFFGLSTVVPAAVLAALVHHFAR